MQQAGCLHFFGEVGKRRRKVKLRYICKIPVHSFFPMSTFFYSFRKSMFNRIEEANLSIESLLYVANQLNIPLSKKQQRA